MSDAISNDSAKYPVSGAGLGLRRPLAGKLKDVAPGAIELTLHLSHYQ